MSLLERLEARTLLSAYVVSSNADDGSAGTLRDAINQVNAGLYDEIDFSGPMTIAVTSALPALTHSVLVNGPVDASGHPEVELTFTPPAATTTPVDGLDVDAGGVTIKGLSIGGFTGAGIVLSGGGDTAQGDYLGIAPEGSSALANGTGLVITSDGNLVVGDVISGNRNDGIDVSGDSNTLQSDFVGTNAAGINSVGNGGSGIVVDSASNTVIGGTAAAARNIISGNNLEGVLFTNDSGSGNVLEGNYIGLDVTGTVAIGNQDSGVNLGSNNGYSASNISILNNAISGNGFQGIYLNNSSANVIRGNFIGTDAAGNAALDKFGNPTLPNGDEGIALLDGAANNLMAGNIISGNNADGIDFFAGSGNSNTVQGNLIGVDVHDLADGNGGEGIYVTSGQMIASGNVISGNFGYGVLLAGGGSTLTGNFIGTDAAGDSLGNSQDGIYIKSNNNVIGSATAGQGNVIAFNGVGSPGAGVYVFTGTGNAIRGNSIYSNNGLGIALGASDTAVAPNDSLGHSGPNNYQNFPVISSASGTGTTLTVSGTLAATPNASFTIDFFSNTVADPTGYGQGQTYLGSAVAVTDASGNASFSVSLPNASSGQLFISATATDLSGNTSEFAKDANAAWQSSGPATPTITTTPSPVSVTLGTSPVTLSDTAILANGNAETGTITFTLYYNGGTTPVDTEVVTVHGDGNYTTPNGYMLPTSGAVTGNYQWDAVYSGDGNNTAASDLNDAAERVTVSPASPTISTTPGQSVVFGSGAKLTDSATLAGGYYESGTIVFKLYAPTDTTYSNPLDTESVTVNGNGTYSTPSGFVPTVAGTYQWVASYSGDANNNGVSGANGSEPETVVALGTITGTVFCDDNLNGQFDSGEEGLAGAVVTLTDSSGHATNTTTNQNGLYTFANLPAGTYTITVTTPAAGHMAELSHGTVTINPTASQTLTGGENATGVNFAEISVGGLSGFIWDDANNDGKIDWNEVGVPNVVVTLTGTDIYGDTISASMTTDDNGQYVFDNLTPGTYSISETLPSGITQGKLSLGNSGGSICSSSPVNSCSNSGNCSRGYFDCSHSYCSNNSGNQCGSGQGNGCGRSSQCGSSQQQWFCNIPISGCSDYGTGYNFGASGGSISCGSTASIGFWHGNSGQSLLDSLNGSSKSTAMGQWLASTFPNLYGTGSKVNFANMTNAQIASYYNLNDFAVYGMKLNAEVLATALACYATSSKLAGGNYAASYGFHVDADGSGYETINVGSNGAAFNVANNTTISILQALDATNADVVNSVLYGGSSSLDNMASIVYGWITQGNS